MILRRLLRGKLWTHPDFLKLWSGESVSEFGSQVTVLALPTVAILVLKATAFQIGLLGALEFLAFPVLGLVAGVYADRWRRRPIMIACDIGRAIALGSIPVAAVLGTLTMTQLYLVAVCTGIFRVFFDVSYQSYLPALIERSDLIEGNSKLQVSESAAQIGGPPLAGFLIQVVGGAQAIAVDAFSFLVSAVAILAIRKPEPEPRPSTAAGVSGFLPEMKEGVEVVFRSPYLWRIAGCTATSNLGSNMLFAVFLTLAVINRHTPASHKRLILLASISLLGAPIARVPLMMPALPFWIDAIVYTGFGVGCRQARPPSVAAGGRLTPARCGRT